MVLNPACTFKSSFVSFLDECLQIIPGRGAFYFGIDSVYPSPQPLYLRRTWYRGIVEDVARGGAYIHDNICETCILSQLQITRNVLSAVRKVGKVRCRIDPYITWFLCIILGRIRELVSRIRIIVAIAGD